MVLLYPEAPAECTTTTSLPSPPQASAQVQPSDMSAQDYFSARPIAIGPRPEDDFVAQYATHSKHARSTSRDSIASNPTFLRPCCSNLGTSPSQRAISFSSWTRYSPSAAPTPSGQLKASLLCKASGTTSSYDPPVSEWTFLGAGQPVYSGKPFVRPGIHQRQKSSGSSSTLSSMSLASEQPGAITFSKQPVKRISMSSQLTASIKGSSLGSIPEGTMSAVQRLGLEGMTCEDLPSAFDDSDDEEED